MHAGVCVCVSESMKFIVSAGVLLSLVVVALCVVCVREREREKERKSMYEGE